MKKVLLLILVIVLFVGFFLIYFTRVTYTRDFSDIFRRSNIVAKSLRCKQVSIGERRVQCSFQLDSGDVSSELKKLGYNEFVYSEYLGVETQDENILKTFNEVSPFTEVDKRNFFKREDKYLCDAKSVNFEETKLYFAHWKQGNQSLKGASQTVYTGSLLLYTPSTGQICLLADIGYG